MIIKTSNNSVSRKYISCGGQQECVTSRNYREGGDRTSIKNWIKGYRNRELKIASNRQWKQKWKFRWEKKIILSVFVNLWEDTQEETSKVTNSAEKREWWRICIPGWNLVFWPCFWISMGEGRYCGDSDLVLWISASSVIWCACVATWPRYRLTYFGNQLILACTKKKKKEQNPHPNKLLC